MSQPINIILNGNNDIIQFIFDLTLTFNNDTILKFKELQYNKYCNLFSYNDKIPFNSLKSFNIYVTILYKNSKEVINISKKFMTSNDTYIYNDTNFYIEYIKNDEGFVNCSCYIKTLDHNTNFNTPPNY